MAKALLGQRVYVNDTLLLESARLRSRVRDLESMIEDLQHDNDRLRDERLRQDRLRDELREDRLREDARRDEASVEVGASRQPVH